MKIEKLGTFNVNRTVEYNITNSIRSCLLYLDRFLEYLSETKSDILENFTSNLTSKLQTISENNFEYSKLTNFDLLKNQFIFLRQFPELIYALLNLHLSLLKIPKNHNWERNTVTLFHINTDKANYYYRYYILKQLTELLDRNEAINLFKDFLVQSVNKYVERPRRESITEIFELDVKNGKREDASIYISALINEGLYAGRVDRCMGHEALKELNDPILTEIVTCFADFAKVQKTNENFVLTRSCTLHTGPYCDNLYHDIRIIEEVKHLQRDFFDKLDDKIR